MVHIIEKVEKIVVGTEPITVNVDCRSFFIENAGETSVCFKESAHDEVPADMENGFMLDAGDKFSQPLNAQKLSIVSGAAGGDVRIMYIQEAL